MTAPPAPDATRERTDILQHATPLVDVFAFTVRVDADGALEWLYFGPNSEAVWGAPATDARSLSDLLREHAEEQDCRRAQEFVEGLRSGQRAEAEIRIAGLDGRTRWVSWRAVPRFVGGQLFVDGVATEVTTRHALGRSRLELAEAQDRYARELDLRRRHALALRDANDNVLQRLFAAGLRLQVLRRRLDTTDAHAASAIAFQLDQAATDLRELIVNLNTVIDGMSEADVDDGVEVA